MRIPQLIYDQMRDHVLESVPREACGVVAVMPLTFVPTHVYCCANVAEDPAVGYVADADDLRYAIGHMEEAGWVLGAVYHSHPEGRACLSLRDLEYACPDGRVLWPGVVQLVWGRPDIIRPGMLHDPANRLAVQGTRLVQATKHICRLEPEPLEVV